MQMTITHLDVQVRIVTLISNMVHLVTLGMLLNTLISSVCLVLSIIPHNLS